MMTHSHVWYTWKYLEYLSVSQLSHSCEMTNSHVWLRYTSLVRNDSFVCVTEIYWETRRKNLVSLSMSWVSVYERLVSLSTHSTDSHVNDTRHESLLSVLQRYTRVSWVSWVSVYVSLSIRESQYTWVSVHTQQTHMWMILVTRVCWVWCRDIRESRESRESQYTWVSVYKSLSIRESQYTLNRPSWRVSFTCVTEIYWDSRECLVRNDSFVCVSEIY